MLRAAVALSGLLLLLGGCRAGSVADVARDDEGRPTEAGTVRADRLRDGDCFDQDDDPTPGSFPVVPCDEPHDNQAFARFPVTGETRPSDDVLTELATTRCGAAFAELDAPPGFAYFAVVPSPETWSRDGDRTVVCALYRRDQRPIVGSLVR